MQFVIDLSIFVILHVALCAEPTQCVRVERIFGLQIRSRLSCRRAPGSHFLLLIAAVCSTCHVNTWCIQQARCRSLAWLTCLDELDHLLVVLNLWRSFMFCGGEQIPLQSIRQCLNCLAVVWEEDVLQRVSSWAIYIAIIQQPLSNHAKGISIQNVVQTLTTV